MPTGLYRDKDDWVLIDRGDARGLIPRIQYVAMGYLPPFDALPTKKEHEARRRT